eukprot:TRINITY_DN10715_c0_g1_i1.p1 TRINITY_DN10715_c0_g1~~TRINITY_DN10715_c0_g1_i1.p1  ORF type:complete len:283 (+),score=41.69 TRINITY_DN10715_c0_g1_i1:111-851(+)
MSFAVILLVFGTVSFVRGDCPDDYSVSRNGVTAFTVSATNGSCSCIGGFAGDGSQLDLASHPLIASLIAEINAVKQQQQAVGTISPFAGVDLPSGWLWCNGSLLPRSAPEYQALWNVVGTTYGGDGVSTFAVPDLRGRVPVGAGQGPALSEYALGQRAGTESVTLTVSNMPAHNHQLKTVSEAATARLAGNHLAEIADPSGTVIPLGGSTVPTDSTLAADSISIQGGGMPVDIRQPYTALKYMIKF